MNKKLFALIILVGFATAQSASAITIKSLLKIKGDLEKQYVDVKVSQGASAATALSTSESLKANAKSKDLTKTVVDLQKEVEGLKTQQQNKVNNVVKTTNIGVGSTDKVKIKALQSKLIKLGYKITADGKFGTGTANAVKKFQKANKLPETGIIDATTSSLILK